MAQLQIRFQQTDPEAKADITAIAVNTYKPWSVIADLKYDNVPLPGNYATNEWNYTIADGSIGEFPDDTAGKTWGLWSNVFSDENGNFSAPPTLDISFSAYHKAPGLTFYFYPYTNDYAQTVRVTWYSTTTATTAIRSGTYTLASNIGVVREEVDGFRHIKVEFLSTNIQYRYLKLYALEYGIVRLVEDSEIDACQILEEIDPTVESISINTMNATIRTRTPFFSPVSGEEADDMMMRRQVLTVARGGAPFGTFFLEGWEDVNQSGIVFDLEAGDAISVLDLYTFNGGIYNNVLVSDILNQIFTLTFPTGLISYILDDSFASSRVSGWIPICFCGEAFQHVMFAINAIADTSRIGNVWIYPRDTEVTYDVPLTQQRRSGSSIKPTDYWSGVDVVSYNYVAGTESVELHNGQLSVGQHRIEFSEPIHSLTITGGTLTTIHVNYAVVTVTTAGTVILTGKRYVDNQSIHSVRSDVSAGEVESVKRYEGYTLVSPSIGFGLAQKIFAYLQHRIRYENDIWLHGLELGYMASVETGRRNVVGTITSLDINLRADTAAMEVVGNVE